MEEQRTKRNRLSTYLRVRTNNHPGRRTGEEGVAHT